MSRDASTSPSRRRQSGFASRLERCCCNTLTYFPLVFVYGLTSWAAWVGVRIGTRPYSGRHLANVYTSIFVGALYLIANISYTVAVFTNPGSPTEPVPGSAYSSLPNHDTDAAVASGSYSSLMAKSSGKPRYCKKCQCPKPDRAHHCSTCNQCVLKMDHHCPWLATCVGFRNYKAFLLFLVYTSAFCWACFLLAGEWVWRELFNIDSMEHSTMTVNIVLLAVLAGIIGLVLSGFTGWHIYLAVSGQTTIECLEKTRYLSPLKKSMEQQLQRANHRGRSGPEQSEPLLDQLKEIHANALPGVTRPEEGEERSNTSTPTLGSTQQTSPAAESLRRSYRDMEEQREWDRYAQYLDEQDSQKLPHAFNLGWRRNLSLLFGSRRLLWALPLPSTPGDGWTWEVSEQWITKRDELARERLRQQQTANRNWQNGPANGFAMRSSSGYTAGGAGRHYYEPPVQRTSPGRRAHPGVPVQMQRLDRGDEGDEYDTSSDEERRTRVRVNEPGGMSNWNDVPAEFLSDRASSRRRGSRGRQKGD